MAQNRKQSGQTPDFAYPAKVEATAARDLDAALKKGNGEATVNALVRLGLAKAAVSADSIRPVLKRIEEVNRQCGEPATKALLWLLEADIYSDVYSNNSYAINRRATVAGLAGEDYNLWSKAQFEGKIVALTDSASAYADELKRVALSDYKSVVDYERGALTFYPTLYDFVAYKTIGLLRMFDNSGVMLNGGLAERPFDRELFPVGKSSIARRVLTVYCNLSEGREESAPGVMARKNALEYVLPRVFETDGGPRVMTEDGMEDVDDGENRAFRAYMKAYRELEGSEYAVELLMPLDGGGLDGKEKKELYGVLRDFELAHGNYFNINAVKNMISQLSYSRVNLDVPQQAAKGVPFKVRVNATNIGKLKVKVYDVTAAATRSRDNGYYNGSYYELPATLPAPKQVYDVEMAGEVPFSCDTVVEMTLPAYGVYVIVPEYDGAKLREFNYPYVACSDLSGGMFGGKGREEAIVVDPMTGAPVSGVGMRFQPWSRNEPVKSLPGVTDGDGCLKIEETKRGNVTPVKGDDKYAPSFYFRQFSEWRHSESVMGNIFTDLGLYHPGDEMKFSVVVYNEDGNSLTLATGKEVEVELRDANYQPVDTVSLVTDEWGRAEGGFTLPTDGLTGTFMLRLNAGKNFIGSKGVMVSDYKLPTFEVKADKVKRPAKLGDTATVGGSVETYAGFPVADAQVKVQLKVRSGMWFWATTSPVFYETESTTDQNGDFEVMIPGDVMVSSPCPTGVYVATVAVTSADGETHEATAGFNLGKPMVLNAGIPDLYVPGESGSVTVELKNYDGEAVDSALSYEIKRVERKLYGGITGYETVKEGECRPGNVGSLLDGLSSGEYVISFATVDGALADKVEAGPFVVYRKDDTASPVEKLLWLPREVMTAGADGEAEVVFATAVAEPKVLMVVSDDKGNMIERRWVDARKGVNRVKLSLGEGMSSMRAYFRIVSRMESASASVTVNSYASQKEIKIKTETFRDKVRPGDKETVTLKVSGLNGADVESAVMLDMSNKAIDQLASNPFKLLISRYGSQYLIADGWNMGWNNVHSQSAWKSFRTVDVNAPEFNLYGRSFMPEVIMNTMRKYNTAVRIRGTSTMAASAAGTDDMNVVREHKAEVMVEEAAADCVLEESEVMGSDAGNGGAEEKAAEAYRPSELPLAFFKPMLTTGSNGELEVTYTVPDANTTWILRSLAYNRELLTGWDEVEIVASKPLMVSANAPRFVRCGDKVVLKASVMNASDSVVAATTVSEVLDPVTGGLIAIAESTDSVAGRGRAVVTMEFEVPEELQGAIYRVRSTAGSFTDGEQVLMPVLPSEQNVVESQQFYIAPDQAHFSMKLNGAGEGRAYLNFTENPSWQVVSALPGLRKGEIDSSVDAAAALFSAAVAEGLMRENPEIARTLRKWSENPTDSALTSQLQKNDQLKQILLSSTPWVSEALSQTERMQRLVLLLDGRNTSAAMAKAVASLEKTADGNGGWYWTKDYPQVSEWCTMQILDMMGDLNRMGWLPANGKLNRMIESALKWIDGKTAKEFAKYPKSDYSRYCYMRQKFPAVKQSTAAAKVTSATVQRIIGEWKEHGVAAKAVDAIILTGNNYGATARTILESLREYATVTVEKGMWWQQLEQTHFMSLNKVGITAVILDAFHMAEPGCDDIDKIRQWLILNKTNNDWGNAVITSQVIASVLTSGRKWTVNPNGTAIRINDTLIEPDNAEYATGAFTEQITGLVRDGGTLTIDRQANYPSFGGVVTMRVLPMDSIKAVGCEELTIEKRMSVYDGSEWVPSDSFKVGDRVKVTLAIKADTDLQYVVITDQRGAGLEPVEQLPTPMWSEGLCFYRENRDDRTNIFVNRMPRGSYILEYELFATVEGVFSSGVASAQSQYNPTVAAHSAGARLTIK